jgi:hypothetical protein
MEGVWLYESASVAAKTRHFEELFDLRKPSQRTVDCSGFIGVEVTGLDFFNFFLTSNMENLSQLVTQEDYLGLQS